MVTLYLIISGIAILLSKVCAPLYIFPPAVYEGSSSPTSSPTMALLFFLLSAIISLTLYSFFPIHFHCTVFDKHIHMYCMLCMIGPTTCYMHIVFKSFKKEKHAFILPFIVTLLPVCFIWNADLNCCLGSFVFKQKKYLWNYL